MANVLVERSSLTDIANAIRAKGCWRNTFKPSEMAAAIESIIASKAIVVGSCLALADGTASIEGTTLTGPGTYSDHTIVIE